MTAHTSLHLATREFHALSPSEFRSEYFDVGRPVLLRNFLKSWPAFRHWSPAAMSCRFVGEMLVVMRPTDSIDRNMSPYGMSETISMAAFASVCEAGEERLYAVAHSQVLCQPQFGHLFNDMVFDPLWFNGTVAATHVKLWMGPLGTVTPLHHDLQDALLAQAYGRKRVLLFAPNETPRLYKGSGGYSSVDPEMPDMSRFPQFNGATMYETTIEHGDALFIPFAWWHHVRSLSPSISLSISNFAWNS